MKTLKTVALGCVPLVTVFLCLVLWQVYGLVKDVRGSSGIVGKLNSTLDHINRPCKGSGKDKADNCGTLALAGQTMVDAGDLIKRSDAVEDKETAMLNVDLPKLFSSINGTVSDLGDTATEFKETAKAATGTLDATTTTVQAAKPVLDNASTFVADLNTETKPVITQADTFLVNANTLATNKDIPGILSGVNTGLATGNHMLLTADHVETKLTKCTLNPTFGCTFKADAIFGAQVGGYILSGLH